jgi:NAD(P)-dependent dehydrogenase (short-subunit alcohol dehydrogenase family)
MRVCVADLNSERAEQTASELNKSNTDGDTKAIAVKVDVADWDSQAAGFQQAIDSFGRINYVFPVAGVAEGRALPRQPDGFTGPFERPNFSVYDVCGAGMLYTIWLGVQHFRRQKSANEDGFLGKSKSNAPIDASFISVATSQLKVCSHMRIVCDRDILFPWQPGIFRSETVSQILDWKLARADISSVLL